jgi:hypothetical protein
LAKGRIPASREPGFPLQSFASKSISAQSLARMRGLRPRRNGNVLQARNAATADSRKLA